MDGSWGHWAKWNKGNTVEYHIYIESKIAELIRRESNRSWMGDGIGAILFKGTNLQLVDKWVLEI